MMTARMRYCLMARSWRLSETRRDHPLSLRWTLRVRNQLHILRELTLVKQWALFLVVMQPVDLSIPRFLPGSLDRLQRLHRRRKPRCKQVRDPGVFGKVVPTEP